jgi:hypothetical protein
LRDFLAYREPSIDQRGRRLEKVGEFHRSKLPVQFQIAIERAGHIHRGCAGVRHDIAMLGANTLEGHERTRVPAAIETVDFSILPDHGEHVAAEATHHGFGDIHHGSHGQGRIGSVSTCLEDISSHHGRKRCAGTCHAISAINGSASVVERVHRFISQ